VAAIGILKKDNLIRGNVSSVGENLIYVGAKTGVDGIGGADMASQTFKADTDMNELKKNIQKGDPFLERLLLEACLEIAESKLAVGMQDMGAGGLLCSSLEVVLRGRKVYNKAFGCVINSNKIPTKNENMDVSDKLISESQERMLIVVKDKNLDKVYAIFNKWDLEYHCVGHVTNDDYYSVTDGDNTVFQKKIKSFGEYEGEHGESWEDIAKNKNDNDNDTNNNNNGDNMDDNFELIHTYIDGNITYDNTIGNRTIVNNRLFNMNYSQVDLHEINKSIYIFMGDSLQKCHKDMIKTNTSMKILGYINCLNYGDPELCIHSLGRFLYNTNQYAKHIKCPVLGGNVSLYNATEGNSIEDSPIIVMICLCDYK